MGLDIYVGPLTRYYAEEWETVVQQAGREAGIEVRIVRGSDDADVPPIDQVYEDVVAWRDGLGRALKHVLGHPLDWSESPEGDYVTDKPDFDGIGAVLLLAAHQDFPDMALPAMASADFQASSLWQLVVDHQRRRAGGLSGRLGRLFGKTEAPPPASPYEHLYFPELWLPVDFEAALEAPDIGGRPVVVGSVPRLRQRLEHLNVKTFGADESQLDAWRRDGPPEHGDFEATARFGLAVWLRLAAEADKRRQPMILDY